MLARVAPLRRGSLRQIAALKKEDLSEVEQEKLARYGLYAVEEFFMPHITLTYELSNQVLTHPGFQKELAALAIPEYARHFTADTLAIAELDYYGNVKEILVKIE